MTGGESIYTLRVSASPLQLRQCHIWFDAQYLSKAWRPVQFSKKKDGLEGPSWI